ncbi:MAG: hypothetical protein U0414_32995 [Polyangiaceae bacterium]
MQLIRTPRALAAFSVLFALAIASSAAAQTARVGGDLGYTGNAPSPAPNPWIAERDTPERAGPTARGSTGDAAAEDEDAAAERERTSFGGDLAFATEAPIFMGAQGTLKLPYGFLFQAELGALPSFYVNAVDGALVSANVYSEVVSSLVTSGLKNSFVMRLSAGMRPFPAHGFEVLGGYTLTTLGGGVSARAALEAVGGVTLPAQIPDAEIGLQTTLHSFHVSVGWRWVIADHFLVRASVGYLQSVASSSHIEVPDSAASIPGASDVIAKANQTIDSTLDENYKTYVKLPVLGLGLGYSF